MALNVLSLFDGISCGRVALEKANIPINKYYASEVDPYVIKVSKSNYQDIIHLGDVTKINLKNLPQIDLLIGGSPCQGFSFAGKQLNFKDPRSKLFFDYIDIKNRLKPQYFLLENVRMKKAYSDLITSYIGVDFIEIDSKLLTPCNRKRLYWTNIPFNTNIIDKGLVLKDFVKENNVEDITERILAKRAGTLSFKKAWGNVRGLNQVAKCLTASGQTISNSGATNIQIENRFYKLKPELAELLQGLPIGYTGAINSIGPRHKALGNGWQVDIISNIFEGLRERGNKAILAKFTDMESKLSEIQAMVADESAFINL